MRPVETVILTMLCLFLSLSAYTIDLTAGVKGGVGFPRTRILQILHLFRIVLRVLINCQVPIVVA
jgi:hypothetical protein